MQHRALPNGSCKKLGEERRRRPTGGQTGQNLILKKEVNVYVFAAEPNQQARWLFTVY